MFKRISIVLLGICLVLVGCKTNNNEETLKTDFLVVVNKKHPMDDKNYIGENKEAKEAVELLISDMQREGLNVNSAYSGYRTYEYQENLYNKYVSEEGQQEADTYSSRPGYSEHHTGLAFDLKHSDGLLLTEKKEVEWLAENAHKYGFIIRYPKGKESITGYMHEPWHIRYVGDTAKTIKESKLSLEEYLDVEGGDYKE